MLTRSHEPHGKLAPGQYTVRITDVDRTCDSTHEPIPAGTQYVRVCRHDGRIEVFSLEGFQDEFDIVPVAG